MTKIKEILTVIKKEFNIKANSNQGKKVEKEITRIINQVTKCHNCNSEDFIVMGGRATMSIDGILEINKEELEFECNDCGEKEYAEEMKDIKLI